MPSPIGHALAGYAAARLTRVRLTRDDRQLFVFAALVGVLPDLIGQLLEAIAGVPVHGFSHSLLALALVSFVGAALATRRRYRFWPFLLVMAAAYGSHLFADLLRPEYGVGAGEQLFWPAPQAYGFTRNILPHVPERSATAGTLAYARVLAGLALREVLVLGPVAVVCHFIPPRIEGKRTERE